MFKLLVEVSILEKMNSLSKNESKNLKNRLRSLENDPFPDGKDKKEIKGSKKSVYRLRSGNYRFFYIINLEDKFIKITEFLTAEQAHRKYGRI